MIGSALRLCRIVPGELIEFLGKVVDRFQQIRRRGFVTVPDSLVELEPRLIDCIERRPELFVYFGLLR